MTAQVEHPHPNRHRKALRAALTLAGLGLLVWLVGFVAIVLQSPSGVVISLTVVGLTMLLLSPVWYFTTMENLEPDLYQHDQP